MDESVPTMHAVRQAVLEYADWRAVVAGPTADLPTLLEAAFATAETVVGVREE